MKRHVDQPRKPSPSLADGSAKVSARYVANSARSSAALGKGRFAGARHDSSYRPSKTIAQSSAETSDRFVRNGKRASEAFSSGRVAGNRSDSPVTRNKSFAESSAERSRRYLQRSAETSNRLKRNSARASAAFKGGRVAGNRNDSRFARNKTIRGSEPLASPTAAKTAKSRHVTGGRGRETVQAAPQTVARDERGADKPKASEVGTLPPQRVVNAFGRSINRDTSEDGKEQPLRVVTPFSRYSAKNQQTALRDSQNRALSDSRKATAARLRDDNQRAKAAAQPKRGTKDLEKLRRAIANGEDIKLETRFSKFSAKNQQTILRNGQRAALSGSRKATAARLRADNQRAKAIARPKRGTKDLERLRKAIEDGDDIKLITRFSGFSAKNQQTALRDSANRSLTDSRKATAARLRSDARQARAIAYRPAKRSEWTTANRVVASCSHIVRQGNAALRQQRRNQL